MASFEELQSSLAEKDALIAELRLELLERERRIMELEDECDALAVDTGRMREDIQKVRGFYSKRASELASYAAASPARFLIDPYAADVLCIFSCWPAEAVWQC